MGCVLLSWFMLATVRDFLWFYGWCNRIYGWCDNIGPILWLGKGLYPSRTVETSKGTECWIIGTTLSVILLSLTNAFEEWLWETGWWKGYY